MTQSAHTIELYEGNTTLRNLMRAVLAEAGLHVFERDGESPEPENVADLLIVDVDSGLPHVVSRVKKYEAEGKPVIHLGIRISRERYPDVDWLQRPFGRSTFLLQCLTALQVDDDSVEEIRRTADGEPITREIDYDEAMQLREELVENDVTEEDDVLRLEEHQSIIMQINDLVSIDGGGRLVGAISSRLLEADELEREQSSISLQVAVRSKTVNQTMPETPLAIVSHDDAADEHITSPNLGTSDLEISQLVKSVSRMLADSWNSIGSAARTEDRAERIHRVLQGLLAEGVRGASEEVLRIPPGSGFAGSLDTLSVIDLVRTIRDRRLRGRLEIDVSDGTYVIFMDSGFLQGLEVLSGSDDLVVLDVLFRMGRLGAKAHSSLIQGYAAGAILEPVEMKLMRDQLANQDDLERARKVAARETFRRLCMARRGNFSFLEVRQGDGQPWPARGLHSAVDELLLEILREGSMDTGDSQATARTRLVADVAKASVMGREKLTEHEKQVLAFFSGAETLEAARQEFGAEEVDRVVDRLKKIELLKRTDPQLHVPVEIQKHASTVVSPVPDAIRWEEKVKQSSVADNHPTDLKASHHVVPPSVDEVVETGVSNSYEVGPLTDIVGADEILEEYELDENGVPIETTDHELAYEKGERSITDNLEDFDVESLLEEALSEAQELTESSDADD